MKLIKAPQRSDLEDNVVLFLAGSIDMGSAIDWQSRLTKDLQSIDNLVVCNPRRDDWDSSWVQDPTPGTQFHEQVDWELDHLADADVIVYYFADGSASPITLLELGLFAPDTDKSIIIYCTPSFYRYGNVKIVADRYSIPVCSTYTDFLAEIKYAIQ